MTDIRPYGSLLSNFANTDALKNGLKKRQHKRHDLFHFLLVDGRVKFTLKPFYKCKCSKVHTYFRWRSLSITAAKFIHADERLPKEQLFCHTLQVRYWFLIVKWFTYTLCLTNQKTNFTAHIRQQPTWANTGFIKEINHSLSSVRLPVVYLLHLNQPQCLYT